MRILFLNECAVGDSGHDTAVKESSRWFVKGVIYIPWHYNSSSVIGSALLLLYGAERSK